MLQLAIIGGKPTRSKAFPKWPKWDEQEIEAVTEVVKSGQWGRRHGSKVKRFEEAFASYHGARYGICVNSGTSALRLALQAVGISPGDQVIVPAYTFIATASAVLELGAVPVFADINSSTYNIEPAEIDRLVNVKTKAVIPVHFGGRAVDMDEITARSEKYNLSVVEDAAQAWGSEWMGKKVGTLGDVGAFSFQSSKNITAGEGGIILTNQDELAKLCKSFSNCGRLEDSPWYEHHYLGGNVRMTEFQAAILLVQLQRYEEMKKIREQNAYFLHQQLSEIQGIQPLEKDERITANSCHLYIFRYHKEEFGGVPKQRFIEALKAEGIPVSPGYSLPLYEQPLFKNRAFGPGGQSLDLGVDYNEISLFGTETACYREAVWLTQNVLLGTQEDMVDIVKAICKIRENYRALQR